MGLRVGQKVFLLSFFKRNLLGSRIPFFSSLGAGRSPDGAGGHVQLDAQMLPGFSEKKNGSCIHNIYIYIITYIYIYMFLFGYGLIPTIVLFDHRSFLYGLIPCPFFSAIVLFNSRIRFPWF